MQTDSLMAGFPPRAELQVTLGNWRKPPFNKWSFHHVSEIIPSGVIPCNPLQCRELANATEKVDSFAITYQSEKYDLESFLRATDTDAFLVMRRGKILYEFYANGMMSSTPHILMSVSKSVLGLIVGILVQRRALDVNAVVTRWIPEVENTAYTGATLRDLLDMRAGISFDEDYLAAAGPIIEYRKAQNWDPLLPGDHPAICVRFLALWSSKTEHVAVGSIMYHLTRI